jgi:hypothetical protein
LVLVYEARRADEEGDYLKGYVALFDVSGKVKWFLSFPGNVGDPLLAEGRLYVSGIGFLGKIDLRAGAFTWKVEGLYREPGMFIFFELPHLEGHRVVFGARHSVGGQDVAARGPKSVAVDDRSGQVLSEE